MDMQVEKTASLHAANADGSAAPIAAAVFFAPDYTDPQRAEVLTKLLQSKAYNALHALFAAAPLNADNARAETRAGFGKDTRLSDRYFTLCYSTLRDLCAPEDVTAFLYAPFYAPSGSAFALWASQSAEVLQVRATMDFDGVWEALLRYDPCFYTAGFLLAADRNRALNRLLYLCVYGKGVNKVLLRGVLRGYKDEVYCFVRDNYATFKTAERIAAVRLLLPLKNEAAVAELLESIQENETALSVVRLVSTAAAQQSAKAVLTPAEATEFLQESMILGTQFPCKDFLAMVQEPSFAAVQQLFFSVYEGKRRTGIVIVDGDRVLDLNNEPVNLPKDCFVRVLHPVELTGKNEYLLRLNVEQPFPQVRRRTFLPSASDRGGECITGSVVPLRTFEKGRRAAAFTALGRDRDKRCKQVGLERNGVLCVVSLDSDASSVRVQSVRFYASDEVVRMGGKKFVDGVRPLAAADLPARVYSEFMLAVHMLLGRV